MSFFKPIRGKWYELKWPHHALLFLSKTWKNILQDCSFKLLVWWWYINDTFLLWQHGEEKLQEFLDILNCYDPSVNFASKYSREWTDFLDAEIIKKDNRLLTDVFVKATDTHQYLHATSCHVYHSEKSIPYRHALHFYRVSSKNQFFNKRWNDLEVWLKSRGYNEKLVRQQTMNSRKYRRTKILYG